MNKNFKLCKDIVMFDINAITVIGDTNSGSLIGLDKKGCNLIQLIRNGKSIDEEILDEQEKNLLFNLVENKFIELYENITTEDLSVSTAYIHITNRCNLHCVGCYSYDNKRNKVGDLSFDDIMYALKELKSNGVSTLVISGGEPMLREDITDILKYAKQKLNIENIFLITNGTVISESLAKAIRPFVDKVAVSIDSYSKEEPNFIRDKGIFEKVENGIRLLKSEEICVSILPTLHSKNIYKFQKYLDYAEKLGVGISFSILTCDQSIFKDYIPSDEQLEFLSKKILGLEGKVTIADTPLDYSICVRKSCGLGCNIISIGADGSVYPCHMLQTEELKLGNLLVSSLSDILKSNKVKIFRDFNVDNVDGCKECDYKYLCGGGCRARSYYSAKNLNSCDIYCAMNKPYYKALYKSLSNYGQSTDSSDTK